MYIVLVTMIFIISFCILQFQLVTGNNLMAMPMIQDLPPFVQSSKSDSTLKKYKCYFKKFERWCNSCSLQYLPATSATISIYIGGLIQQGISVAILDSSLYAIKWYHDFYFENNPSSNKLVSLILEGGKRL
jgi:site-specific recombinase XerD